MADLDDFFAKKDKKKSRTAVKKFTASELMTSAPLPKAPVVTPSEESVRKPEISPDVPAVESAAVVEPAPPKPRAAPEPDEEEWGEFEQEKEKDYSGLKIQKLQIQDSDGEEEDDEGEHELNEEGELVKREPAGPWNKIGSQQQGPVQTQAKAKEQVVEAPPNTAGGVYIPPSMRNKTAGGPGSGSGSTNRTRGKKDKGAPDLNSEEFFPTLSAAVAIEQNNFKLKKFEQTERGFTEAKPSRSHSNRTGPWGGGAPGEDGPRLNLGNKFNALSNDD